MNILYLLLALLAFSVLIIGHELGHFVLAKLNHVMVEEFSVGMGPKIFGIKGKETEYCLRAVPFGGYIKMLGEQGENSGDSKALSNKNPLQKISIVVAGPFMNLILTILFFAIIGCVSGIKVPIVSQVEKNTPAYVQDVRVGDKILEVDTDKISTWDDFINKVNQKKGKPMNLTLLRDNKVINKKIIPIELKEENRYIIGICASTEKATLGKAITYGFTETKMVIKETFSFLGGMFQKKVPLSSVGGPISVLRISTKAAQGGILTLLWISAYISVQLAIFNLLPIPVLDGGWVLIYIIELITGKKLNEDMVGKVTYVGFILMMTLAVVVTIKDILYPLKL